MLIPLIDGGIVILLIGAFVYMILLNRRLNTINSNRTAIEKLLESFSQSLLKAETSLLKLQENSAKFEKDLQEKIRTGTSLTDDLIFFIDRGEGLAAELEKKVRQARELKQDLVAAEAKAPVKMALPSPAPSTKERLVPHPAGGLH